MYAVKVCSAISSSCSGTALLQGIEYSVDPNGDGDPSDHVDIMNLSLGARYGLPFHDDLSQAIEAASALGVLSVAAGGNGRDRPYVVNTPASVLSVLAVAQVLIPVRAPQLIDVDGENYVGVFQSWSERLESTISGPVQYGDGNGGNTLGCDPYDESLSGKVVLVDRGNCTFTQKVSNIVNASGIAALIAMVDDSRPFNSAPGDERPVNIPSYMISLEDGDSIKAGLPSEATLDPDNVLELQPVMASSSSRGPQNDPRQLIKPEIGAPGGSISAVAGTGDRRGPFGGTSAASPVVAGCAALLLQAFPDLIPAEVKAKLMNNGQTNVTQDISEDEEGLAPITRLGGGNVMVDDSFTARAAAWDMENLQGALSFGFIDVDKREHVVYRRVMVRNYSNDTIVYNISTTFRYEDDEASGAVEVKPNFPGALQLLPKQDRFISVVLTIRGDRLPNNNM